MTDLARAAALIPNRQTIEQMLAWGRSDGWITEHAACTLAEIDLVRAYLDELVDLPDEEPRAVHKCGQQRGAESVGLADRVAS